MGVLVILGVVLGVASLSGGVALSDGPPADELLPDLVVEITGPGSATAGQAIGSQVTISVDNKGDITAPGTTPNWLPINPNGYTVEIVLSSDNKAPIKPSRYGTKFAEDVQLSGGVILRTLDIKPNFALPCVEDER